MEEKKTIFNDPVHGTIVLGEKLVEVINTPQFQRLRNVRQLGACYFVYPGASHNRFEHCIGTCHLAGKLIRHLRDQQPELKITNNEILCVELAGLCHDLGHGPYSHMFDNKFLPKMDQEIKHEKVSCEMFEYLLEKNRIQLDEDSVKQRSMIEMVKRMIEPPEDFKYSKEVEPGRIFLYEIISNNRNKVDVDKWDYFARDCHHLGMPNSFDHERFMKLCRVLELPEKDGKSSGETLKRVTTIGVHEKESKNLYEMFHLRASLHQRAYQHRVHVAIESMICDAMVLTNEVPFALNDEGKVQKTKLSDSVKDMEIFEQLDDNIFYTILRWEKAPKEARQLLQRILKRNLYRCVGSVKYPLCDEEDKKELKIHQQNKRENKKNIELQIFREVNDTNEQERLMDLVDVNVAVYDYGMKYKNPCENFYFYSKSDPKKAFQISKSQVSELLPEKFGEYEIRVFSKCDLTSKTGETDHATIKGAVEKWKKQEQDKSKPGPFEERVQHAMKQIVNDEMDLKSSATKSDINRKRKLVVKSHKQTFEQTKLHIEMDIEFDKDDLEDARKAFDPSQQ